MLRSARALALASLLAGLAAPALAQTTISAPATPAPADAKLYFISPTDGARIRGPVRVQFGLRNMGVAPAGVTTPNAGHHHILINVKEPIDPYAPIPADRSHVHFGGGQTETQLDLPPGRHTLQLVLGDAGHRPFNPIVASEIISVTVIDPDQKPRPRPRATPRRRAHPASHGLPAPSAPMQAPSY